MAVCIQKLWWPYSYAPFSREILGVASFQGKLSGQHNYVKRPAWTKGVCFVGLLEFRTSATVVTQTWVYLVTNEASYAVPNRVM
jgi:hypothetical protein